MQRNGTGFSLFPRVSCTVDIVDIVHENHDFNDINKINAKRESRKVMLFLRGAYASRR